MEREDDVVDDGNDNDDDNNNDNNNDAISASAMSSRWSLDFDASTTQQNTEKNYPSDVVGFLLAAVNVVTVIMTSNVKFRLAVVPLLLFNVGQVFGLYSLQLHERLLFQWDLDFDRDILTAKVTYKPLPSEDGDPKGRGQSINPLGPRVPNPGCLKQFCPRDLSTSVRSKTGGIV